MGNTNVSAPDDVVKPKPGGKKNKEIDENHLEFELAYDMMLGIRQTVSISANKAQSKILASQGNVIISNEDELFRKYVKYDFPQAGSPENKTPPHKMRDFKFKDYAPEIFAQLRDWFGLDPMEYLESLCGQFKLLEFISNSKSGEFFFHSHDRKFFIKTMAKSESLLLRKLLPEYFNYISRQPNTLLTKFFGMHRVHTPGRSPVYFIIMGSVFNSKRDIHKIYDLKGSMYKRKAKVAKGPQAKNKVTTQKDIDWLSNEERIRVDPKTAKLFTHQLRRDIEFLKKSKIMDYSLLVGIHMLNTPPERDSVISDLDENLEHDLKPQTYGINTRIRKQYKYLAKRPTEVGFHFDVPEIDFQGDEREQTLRAIRSNPFTAEDGGMRSESGDCIYFTGIIDILQLYNKRKKLEHMLAKGRPKIDSSTISCIPPDDYGTRMYKFLSQSIGKQH